MGIPYHMDLFKRVYQIGWVAGLQLKDLLVLMYFFRNTLHTTYPHLQISRASFVIISLSNHNVHDAKLTLGGQRSQSIHNFKTQAPMARSLYYTSLKAKSWAVEEERGNRKLRNDDPPNRRRVSGSSSESMWKSLHNNCIRIIYFLVKKALFWIISIKH